MTIGLGGVCGLHRRRPTPTGASRSRACPRGPTRRCPRAAAGWDAERVVAGGAGRRDDRLRPRAAPQLGRRARRGGGDRLQRPRVHGERLRALGRRWTSRWARPGPRRRAPGEKFLVVRLPVGDRRHPVRARSRRGLRRHRRRPPPARTWSRPRPTGSSGPPRSTASSPAPQRHRLNFVTPSAGATGVRFVRLSLLSSQGFGAPFRDMSEFGVYGRVAGADTVEPETTLEPGGPPFVFSSNEPAATFECQGRCGRIRGVHVAARGVVARW